MYFIILAYLCVHLERYMYSYNVYIIAELIKLLFLAKFSDFILPFFMYCINSKYIFLLEVVCHLCLC